MRIGIYGGTFDPVHLGHLLLAQDALEQFGLDRLIFSPNRQSPHKLADEPAPGEWRAAMLRAAVEGEPRFRVDEWELDQPSPSYSVSLVEHIAEVSEPGARFYFLVGADNLAKIETWHRYEELVRKVAFVVLGRDADAPPHSYPEMTRRVDISSTEIRSRVREGKSIRYLVPDKVAEIIETACLYRPAPPLEGTRS